MSRVFPRMTKCTFHKYGSSGTIQRLDALCVLGMNVMNEKIYIFLWFWFILLAVITGFNVALRALQLFCPSVRQRCCHQHQAILVALHHCPMFIHRFVKLEAMNYLDRSVRRQDVETVVSTLPYSDWLILYYLSQAMDKQNFGELMTRMAEDITYQVSIAITNPASLASLIRVRRSPCPEVSERGRVRHHHQPRRQRRHGDHGGLRGQEGEEGRRQRGTRGDEQRPRRPRRVCGVQAGIIQEEECVLTQDY